MIYLVVTEPKQKLRLALIVHIQVVEADNKAAALRAVKPRVFDHDFKRPKVYEVRDGLEVSA